MKKYDYLFFDLDGTIVDTFEGITRSFAYALEHYGIEVASLSDLTDVIGPPLRDSFCNMFGFSAEQANDAVAKYRERYNVHFVHESKLYTGIDRVLKLLKKQGFKLVLATSKPEHFARALLEHYGIIDCFSFIGAASMDKSRDSKPKVIEYVLSELEITDRSRVVMIGDRSFDMEGAQLTGLDAIGVLYGFGSVQELKQYPVRYLAKDADDLYRYLSEDEE